MTQRFGGGRAWLLLVAAATLGGAATVEQPVLLPMPELLKQLDRQQEWLMLPLAEYQTLVAAGQRPTPADAAGPCGSWIETARLTGRVVDDRRIQMRAEMEVVSAQPQPGHAAGPAPSRCRLFARLPDALGSVSVDGAPGLLVPGLAPAATTTADKATSSPRAVCIGIDLLVPGPGRHHAVVTWTVELTEAAGAATKGTSSDGTFSGSLPLPLTVGADVLIDSTSQGDLCGAGLVPVSEQRWTLARPTGAELAVTWHPGRHAAQASAAWGVKQALQVALPDEVSAPRAWRWTADPTVLRGGMPTVLTVRLPHGWIATSSGGGVLELAQTAEVLVLRIDPQAPQLIIDGVAPSTTAVALPAVDGALWQGGWVVMTNASRRDWTLPPRWQRLPLEKNSTAVATGSWRAFTVPGPDAGMQVSSTLAADGLAAELTTTVAIGPDLWRMESRVVVRASEGASDSTSSEGARSDRRFSVPLILPAGWRAVSASGSQGARIAGTDADGALSETPADGVLHIDLPRGLSQALTLTVVLERIAASGPQVVTLPAVEGAQSTQQRLVIINAPSLDVQVAGAGWQRAPEVILPAPAAVPAATTATSATTVEHSVRTVLHAVGAAPPLTLTVATKPAVCEVEAVAWLLPLDAAVWCRMDLRLTVSDGELDAVALDVPLAIGSERLTDAGGTGLTLVREKIHTATGEVERLVLRTSRPWRGERLVRIEGRLAEVPVAAGSITFPHLGVTQVDGHAVATVLHVALQAPERLDLRLEPGAAAQAEDEDDLPRWARAIPGDPVAGVWRIAAGEAGGFAVVSRPLVDPPAGFIHHLEVRTQLTAERMRTLLRFRLAAPGLSALPVRLPPGSTLLAASLDGRPVAVRRTSDEVVIPLPGRTQVEVAVLVDAAFSTADTSSLPAGPITLRLPDLGGLPVTTMAWQVAGDAAWRITPEQGPEVMHLVPQGGAVMQRPWWGAWQDAPGHVDAGPLPQIVVQPPAIDDVRRLTATVPASTPAAAAGAAAEPAHGEPTLALVGQLWRGERLGGNASIVLRCTSLADVRRLDHLGLALAVLLGVWLAWRVRLSTGLAIAGAALSAAAALHLSGLSLGPLLALCEWLAPVLLVALLLRGLKNAFFHMRRGEEESVP